MKQILYAKHTEQRKRQYRIRTTVVSESGKRYLTKSAMNPEALEHLEWMKRGFTAMTEQFDPSVLSINTYEEVNGDLQFAFIAGESLESKLLSAHDRGDTDGFFLLLKQYKNCVRSQKPTIPTYVGSERFSEWFGDVVIPADTNVNPSCNLDMAFDNLLIDPDGQWHLVDYEWVVHFPVPADYPIFRAIFAFCLNHRIDPEPLYTACGLTADQIALFTVMERRFTAHLFDPVPAHGTPLQPRLELGQQTPISQTVYLDRGEGFSEQFSQTLSAIKEDDGRYTLQLSIPDDVKQLRFDPTEQFHCILSHFVATMDGVVVPYQAVNGVGYQSLLLFDSTDPQLLIPLPVGKTGDRQVTLQFFLVSAEAGADFLPPLIQATAHVDQTAQIARLEQQLKEANEALHSAGVHYHAVVTSRFWRMTAPLRALSNKLRPLLQRNRFARALIKLLRSIKNEGISTTAKKVRYRLSGRSYQAPVAATTEALSRWQGSTVDPSTVDHDLTFSILVPAFNTPIPYLTELVRSVQAQSYPNWELCIADASDDPAEEVRQWVTQFATQDARIRYEKIDNVGIGENTNRCAAMATGSYFVLLDHDDVLHPDALYYNRQAIAETGAEVLYSDEDRIDLNGVHCRAFFKPDWSPDLLYSQMYICHLLVFSRRCFEAIGGYRPDYNGAQDYDLMLRLSEQTSLIHHIPKVLYGWREAPTSTAANADTKPYAHTAGLQALDAHLKRTFGEGAYACETEHTFVYQARFTLPETPPLVSIIIPMKDNWQLSKGCVDSILSLSTHQQFEILLLNNNSEEQETFAWFDEVVKQDNRIRVLEAAFPFNWSQLNNVGIAAAKGDVYVFLNNDTVIISPDWLERLCEQALRPDIGVVGPQLRYEDGTLQHAGVVLGMGGFADHVYKGAAAAHTYLPFVSPVLNRNVLAVTGACMAIAKETIDTIGGFDETFIICGSDVELCLRAYEAGFNNLYLAHVALFHLESKSRTPYIPPNDFERSAYYYAPYREEGDPYYNINLNYDLTTPTEETDMARMRKGLRYHLSRNAIARKVYNGIKQQFLSTPNTDIPEAGALHGRPSETMAGQKRLNLLVPTVTKKHVFGGVTTALDFFYKLVQESGLPARVIITDAPYIPTESVLLPCYQHRTAEEDAADLYQVVDFSDRHQKTIPICEGDIFMATAWWTAYGAITLLQEQRAAFPSCDNKLLYFIQDYEPGFYEWSSRYLMADSTYRLDIPTIGIFNSSQLYQFMKQAGYQFAEELVFDPVLNRSLAPFVDKVTTSTRKKQILVYGRPSTARNAFEIIVDSLTEWCQKQPDIADWTILSAGEYHDPIDLGNGKQLQSVGKLDLDQYATMMLETYAGISLMVSPHPSYPPLEMATFGIHTITNHYANKNLSDFSKNIVALPSCSKYTVSDALLSLCKDFSDTATFDAPDSYLGNTDVLREVALKTLPLLGSVKSAVVTD